ncbi:hypothetical protein TNCV_3887171 [Trichonephila clavipes]|nr:hypothetical protein TNCV_3887171 [Trichonephila clavipes]
MGDHSFLLSLSHGFQSSNITGVHGLSSLLAPTSILQRPSLFFPGFSSAKKPFKHQEGTYHAPRTLSLAYPLSSTLGLPSLIRAEHTNTLSDRQESSSARILVQHLDAIVHHTPLFLQAILLTPSETTGFFLDRLRLLSMGCRLSFDHYDCQSECRRFPEVK